MRIGLILILAAVGLAAQRPWVAGVVIDGDPVMRGLPQDAIPAIDRPRFVTANRATFVSDDEPVIGISAGTEARAYPTWLLNAHEIVNDRLGEEPIAVTW